MGIQMDKYKKLILAVFSILLIIFLYSNVYNLQTSNNFANNSSVIKVLIFDGDGAM
jgi:hypothetical protein